MVEGDTLVDTHIDRLSRGLTYGLQVIEGLHRAGVEFRSLAELDQGSLDRGPGYGADRGPFPRVANGPDRAAEGVCPGRTGQGG